ncbi:MAG: MFS transporter [Alicyclobacillaceae bacterium]|nr:MFS transporter [Alicyclobacillaceae bacterium]
MRTSYRQVMKNTLFVRVAFTKLSSQAGYALFWFAIRLFVFDKTHSPFLYSLVVLLPTVAQVTFAPIAGWFVDTWGSKASIILSDSVRILGALAIPFLPIWGILIVGLCVVIADNLISPAESVLVSTVVVTGDFLEANTILSFSARIVGLLGPIAAGILMNGSNGKIVFFSSAALCVLSVFFTAILPLQRTSHDRKSHAEGSTSRLSWKSAWSTIFRDKVLTFVVVFIGMAQTVSMMSDAVVLTKFRGGLHFSSSLIGVVLSLGILSSAIGLPIGTSLGKPLLRRLVLIVSGIGLSGMGFFLIGIFHSHIYTILSYVFLDFFAAFGGPLIISTIQERVEISILGRVIGVITSLVSVLSILAIPMAGLWATWVSPSDVLVICGGTLFLLCMAFLPIAVVVGNHEVKHRAQHRIENEKFL